MTVLSSISQAINFARPIIPSTLSETAVVGIAVISGLYSSRIGGTIGIGYLGYKAYRYFHLERENERANPVVISGLYSDAVGIKQDDSLAEKTLGKRKHILPNGDCYEGNFMKDRFHGKGKLTFMRGGYYEGDFFQGIFCGQGKRFYPNGNYYEGRFFSGKYDGKGKFSFANGGKYEGDFVNGKFHGKGKLTFVSGTIYEGDFVDGYIQGNGKQISPDGFVYEGEFFQNAIVNSNISNLGDRLFYHLLNGLRPYGALRGYNLGIIADYLKNNGYQELGSVLSSAHRLLRIFRGAMTKESKKIHKALNQGLPQLFSYGCKGHSMGLNLVPYLPSGFVLCEIFNSGQGLSKYHEPHPIDFRKYKTMLQIKVPIKSITPKKIKTILLHDYFRNVDEAYRYILNFCKSPEIIKKEDTPWQTIQKGGECDLRWILTYLKNQMLETEYKKMLIDLRENCSNAYKAGSSYYEDENEELIWRKQINKCYNVNPCEGNVVYEVLFGN